MATRRIYKKWPREAFNINHDTCWAYYTARGMCIVIRDPERSTLSATISWKKLQIMMNCYRKICEGAEK